MEGAGDLMSFWSVLDGIDATRSCEMSHPVDYSGNEKEEERSPSTLFRLLFDFVFGPISDYLQGDELVVVPGIWVDYGPANLNSKLKRKSRHSSGSEAVSPDGKRICEVSNKEIESSADGKGKNLTPPSTMTDIVQQLQQVLERLTSVEGKLDGVLEMVQRLETALSGVQSDITDLHCMTTQLKKATDDMDAGLNNLNMEVQELRKKIDENEKEIKLTSDRCLYQEVYNRRENLRFLGFPEATGTEEVASEVVYKFLQRELELDGARGIEFQRVHRIGRKKTGARRPIIARFFKVPRPGTHF